MKKHFFLITVFILIFVVACEAEVEPAAIYPTPTLAIDISKNRVQDIEIITFDSVIRETAVPFDYSKIAETEEKQRQDAIAAIESIEVRIDTTVEISNISPHIYGLALSDIDAVESLRPSVYNWTGDGAMRYNITKGRGWNLGREESYVNSNAFPNSGNHALDFIDLANSIDAASSFTLPTLGWVAKDTSTCSFPDPVTGECTTGRESTCLSQSINGNPNLTSIEINPDDMIAFLQSVKDAGESLDFISLMYEPELWGIIHYDVHPECMTYRETLDIYQAYSAAIREVVPEAELMGPGTCCWDFYFNSPSGPIDKVENEDKDFIPWFLEKMAEFDAETGKRHLDVLNIHYYPQNLTNDFTDIAVAEHRLRAPWSLYDPLYVDESYINEPVQLIPRMNAWIDEFYPGTKLGIGAWNFGAAESLNGAIAIAEVLGIFGQEELHFASFYPELLPETPGYYAFKMYTNYDNQGGNYGDLAIQAESNFPEVVSAYSSIDLENGNLHIILINRIENVKEFEVEVIWDGFESTGVGAIYQYTGRDLEDFSSDEDPGITGGPRPMGVNKQILQLPGYSITHMILEPSEAPVENQE